MKVTPHYVNYPAYKLIGRFGITREVVVNFLDWCQDVEYALCKKKSKKRAKVNGRASVGYIWHYPQRQLIHESTTLADGEEDCII